MELGLRALVAAGASRVATIQQWDGYTFVPRYGSHGVLENSAEFEAYLAAVRREGMLQTPWLKEP